MNLNELRDRAYKCACEHGFHDQNYPDYHWLMLTICELGETIDADRNDRHADRDMFERAMKDPILKDDTDEAIVFYTNFKKYIKDTVEDELADVVIRLFDFAGLKGIDFTRLQGEIDHLSKEDVKFKETDFFGDLMVSCFSACNTLSAFTLSACEKVNRSLCIVLTYTERKGANLEWHIEQKMRFNELRPRLNGKKY